MSAVTIGRPDIRRGASERLAAWLTTGPLGHLYSTVADIVAYAVAERRRKRGVH